MHKEMIQGIIFESRMDVILRKISRKRCCLYLKQVSVIFWCTNKIKLKRYKEDETMLECLKKINKEKTGLFAAGVLFGTAGIKILTSKDAKKLYTQCTAAVLRAKECVMKTVTSVQENAEDIYAEAKEINEERAAQDAELGADVTVEETDITEDAEESAEQE